MTDKVALAYLLRSVNARYVEVFYGDERISEATGFVVEHEERLFLISNRHVLAGMKPGSMELVDKAGRQATSVRITSYVATESSSATVCQDFPLIAPSTAGGYPSALWFEHPTYGNTVDVAALELTDLQAPDYALQDETVANDESSMYPIRQLDTMTVIGYPGGVHGGVRGKAVWMKGTVASDYADEVDGLPRFLIDSRTRAGMSGSPVYFSAAGRSAVVSEGILSIADPDAFQFVGVYSGRIFDESDVGYVWRAKTMWEIVVGEVLGQAYQPI
ncbi:trypsin-like peptidase domain-containing protein [Herbiconiux ginsengi]|uniref:Trypsin-like peptidase domain-containing protein n=1 Tax=Herbiconiux ginsengi TaxID=381665 RepID=A0A1H3QT60_9MICO|nr:trypsin-like peptidase domain-containing protein [Herbiconiux ginsengi]SDZ16195.1 Trypsin-like peptidase domain-containing protein [Herbiconiux ginsengi]